MKMHCSASHIRSTLFGSVAFICFLIATSNPGIAQRLPGTIHPEHYTLSLTPDLKAATFSGTESVDVALAEPTNAITLNAAEITFQPVVISVVGKRQAASISLDKEKEQATFTVADKLPIGKATLTIQYTGILNNELRGFYLSKTPKRNYAVTQFEPTDARRAFPSFDEPAFKAVFDISLTIDSGDTAISNTEVVADTAGPNPGKHTLRFAATPKLSTYLVAFLVGDFQCSSGNSDGVAIRSCATPDKVALTPYSVDVARYMLHYYDTYFGIPYPLKKLDLIAIPDFEAGAMENLGAITFRETALLLYPKTASIDTRKEVAIDIAHEMAHQWFGDMVTMNWWDNLWLNEGFATWMETKSVAVMHPEWNIDHATIASLNDVLNLDAQPTTRAIRAKADTPDEINQMFDGIAYGKAGAVLLTVENYLGPETFRKGVHAYLAAHLYANATAEDFWNAQTEVSRKPVDKIMASLVFQPGVPLLTFGEPANGYDSVSQKRFFLSPGIQADPAQQWTLPVCFKTAKNSPDCQVLPPSETRIKIPASNLFFANAGGKGYYRSSYPPDVYAALVEGVESRLTPEERISLIADQWAQVRADKATAGSYLDLVGAIEDDRNSEVLGNALGGVTAILQRVAATADEKAALAMWIRNSFTPQYAKLGPPSQNDSLGTRELRAQLFGILGYYGNDPAILAQAREIAENYLADPASVEPTMGRTALYITARNGDAALFDRLQKIYETSTNPEFQDTALRLLAAFHDPALVERSLEYAASGKVRNQDAAIQFSIALDDEKTRNQAWSFIKAHWDKVQAQFTTNMGSALVASTGGFCSADERDDVEQFFAAHKVAASEHALTHAIERINGCIELRKLQEPNLKQWLAAQPKS